MKKILISAMLCLGLAACGRNSIEHPVNVVPPVAPVVQPVPPPPVVPITKLIKTDAWEMTVPNDWEKMDAESDDADLICFASEKEKALACLEKHAFSDSLEVFVQAGAESVVETGGHIIAAQTVSINNAKFTVLSIKKNSASLWSWLTIQHNFAYALTCGGASPTAQESCDKIANSLSFK